MIKTKLTAIALAALLAACGTAKPIQSPSLEVAPRFAQGQGLAPGHVPQPEEGEPLPLAIVVARRHGIQALPCPMHMKFGNSN